MKRRVISKISKIVLMRSLEVLKEGQRSKIEELCTLSNRVAVIDVIEKPAVEMSLGLNFCSAHSGQGKVMRGDEELHYLKPDLQ